ncbi:MAG: hypothetical protein AAF727_06775 [Pseudomonadota bacterium]
MTREDRVLRHWDIAHHLKMGARTVRAALNPKPGVRVALSHSMGWTLAPLNAHEFKLLAEPMWRDAHEWHAADLTITCNGYDALDGLQNWVSERAP